MENRIREFRNNIEMTQDDLAQAAGVSRQTIISLESCRYNPSIILAFKLSKVFNTTIEEIFIFDAKEVK